MWHKIKMTRICKYFRCWRNPSGFYDLEIKDKFLYINADIPYRFKWVQINSALQQECYSKIYFTQTCRCKLPNVNKGKYYLYIYGSDNGLRYESFIVGRQIILDFNNCDGWNFRLPLYSKWNLELLKSDNLEYVLYDSIFHNSRSASKFVRNLTSRFVSERDKVRAIHDFVASNLYYDYDSLASGDTQRTIQQVVNTKKCLCQGYADLTLFMLKSIGFEVENILCYAVSDIVESGWSSVVNRTSELNHIITRVRVDGNWLYMDVTWDSGNKYENGEFIKGKLSHRYFDVTVAFLSTTHRFFKKDAGKC